MTKPWILEHALYSLVEASKARERAAGNEQWPVMYMYDTIIDNLIHEITSRAKEPS